jgi:hypothetical protein
MREGVRVKPRELLILGPPRSGTTLMGHLLGGADGVLCLSEPFLSYAVMTHWQLNRFYYYFEKSAGLRRLRPPREGRVERYASFLRKLAGMNALRYLAIKETFRDEMRDPRWRNVALLDRLVDSGNPIVALIRHPYDVAVSTIRLCHWVIGMRGRLLSIRLPALPVFRNRTEVVASAARNWTNYSLWARRHGLDLLRYEDFVGEPEPHLREICRRCELPFDPQMLDHRRPRAAFGGLGDPGLLRKGARPVTTKSVGQADKLTTEQREIVKSACAEHAPEFGYTL